jgi:hypothetical protein
MRAVSAETVVQEVRRVWKASIHCFEPPAGVGALRAVFPMGTDHKVAPECVLDLLSWVGRSELCPVAEGLLPSGGCFCFRPPEKYSRHQDACHYARLESVEHPVLYDRPSLPQSAVGLKRSMIMKSMGSHEPLRTA